MKRFFNKDKKKTERRIKSLIDKGNYNRAITFINTSLVNNENSPNLLFFKGYVLFKLLREQEAINSWLILSDIEKKSTRINKINELLPILLVNHAISSFEQYNFEGVLFDSKRALKINKKHPIAWYLKGLCDLYFFNYEEAIQALRNVIKFEHFRIRRKRAKRLLTQIEIDPDKITYRINHVYPELRFELKERIFKFWCLGLDAFSPGKKKKKDKLEIYITKKLQESSQPFLKERYEWLLKRKEEKERKQSNLTHQELLERRRKIKEEIEKEKSFEALNQAITSDAINVELRLEKGILLKELKRFKEALEAFNQLLTINSIHKEAWMEKGLILKELGRYEEAIEAFNELITLDPKNSEGYCNIGQSLFLLNKFEEALEAVNQAITLDPDNNSAWHYEDVILKSLERHKEALRAANKRRELKSKMESQRLKSKGVLGSYDTVEEALNALNHTITTDPKNIDAWMEKVIILKELGNNKEVFETFNQILALEPKNKDVWREKGLILKELGRYEEAIEAFNEVVTLDPKSSDGWLIIGRIHYLLENYKEAIEALNQVIAIDPKNDSAWHYKGVNLKRLGHEEEALRAFIISKTRKLKIGSVVIESHKKVEDALKALNHTITTDPKNIEAWMEKGIILNELGRYKEASETLDQILTLEPKNVEAWMQKGLNLKELGRYEKAIEVFNNVIALDPKNSDAWCFIGRIFYLLNKFEEALEALNQALTLDPENDDALHYRGIVLKSLGREDEVLRVFDDSKDQKLTMENQDLPEEEFVSSEVSINENEKVMNSNINNQEGEKSTQRDLNDMKLTIPEILYFGQTSNKFLDFIYTMLGTHLSMHGKEVAINRKESYILIPQLIDEKMGWFKNPTVWQIRIDDISRTLPKFQSSILKNEKIKVYIKMGYGYRLAVCKKIHPEFKTEITNILLKETMKIDQQGNPPLIIDVEDIKRLSDLYPVFSHSFKTRIKVERLAVTKQFSYNVNGHRGIVHYANWDGDNDFQDEEEEKINPRLKITCDLVQEIALKHGIKGEIKPHPEFGNLSFFAFDGSSTINLESLVDKCEHLDQSVFIQNVKSRLEQSFTVSSLPYEKMLTTFTSDIKYYIELAPRPKSYFQNLSGEVLTKKVDGVQCIWTLSSNVMSDLMFVDRLESFPFISTLEEVRKHLTQRHLIDLENHYHSLQRISVANGMVFIGFRAFELLTTPRAVKKIVQDCKINPSKVLIQGITDCCAYLQEIHKDTEKIPPITKAALARAYLMEDPKDHIIFNEHQGTIINLNDVKPLKLRITYR
ncbi:MAG: tetratricopeptide repeat protein [Candidatus Hodarchaeales archaeon]|jgi:tetratricopeptide (TPR) repeat protein